jgi:nucleoside-diphosphate-sugar epimerase
MDVLVTGGAGYIGSVLVPELLRAGHRVVVVDSLRFGAHGLARPFQNVNFGFVKGDVRSLRMLMKNIGTVDAVIHLAALRLGECKHSLVQTKSINTIGTAHVAEWCKEIGAKLVFSSSCSVYGSAPDLVDEKAEPAPTTVYAKTKVEGEESVLGMGGTVLRLATVYGKSPNTRWDTIVNKFVKESRRDGKLEIFSALAWRPVVHISDVARAFVLMLEVDKPGEIYNIGEQNCTKQDLIDCLKTQIPDLKVMSFPEVKDPRSYRVSFAKAYDELGFHATRDVRTDMFEVGEL